jgi:hypothetical protein
MVTEGRDGAHARHRVPGIEHARHDSVVGIGALKAEPGPTESRDTIQGSRWHFDDRRQQLYVEKMFLEK